ncbi:hypothetical protein HN615_12005 [Candidatus Woesearchaeota archaeon]|nr:hypothetical protein [Candidatus Woesearchaeota archaeon]
MNDITQYGENELSLHVFNDEYLYNARLNKSYLMALISEEFIYTDEQMDVLIQDLDDEE